MQVAQQGGYGPPGYGPPPGGGYGGYGPPPGAPGGHGSGFGGPGAPHGQPAGGPMGPGGPRQDQLAVAGLISSILGLVGALLNGISGLFGACCFLCAMGATVLGFLVLIPSVAGAIMGGISMARINKEPGKYSGKGMAVAALAIGVGASLLAIAEIILPWLGVACFTGAGMLGN